MELLEFTPALCQLISEGKSIHELRKHGVSQNHLSLERIGEQLIKTGKITRKEFDSVYG
jgi:type II secretory ATPase GspE/PulE/Tfp pilus assembly ATPase PilB-like protein